MKILLIEDNLLNQKVVIYYLNKLDCFVTAVKNGYEALDKIKTEKFDLILMDIMLPGINGYDTTRKIREYETELKVEKRIPIIALTANTYDNDREKCMEAGMNDYLEKPFTSEQLQQIVLKFI